VQCKSCQQPAAGACKACGGFYCAAHGGASAAGPLCAACYDGRRPFFGLAALLEIGLGLFALYIASRVEAAPLFVAIALGAFTLAGFAVWCAARRFPAGPPGSLPP
jgi:hypothetical protein